MGRFYCMGVAVLAAVLFAIFIFSLDDRPVPLYGSEYLQILETLHRRTPLLGSNGSFPPCAERANICAGCDACTFPAVSPAEYSSTFLYALGPYALACMQGGIPDSDTITNAAGTTRDTAVQRAHRRTPIGPVAYVSEVPGFQWSPGTGVDGRPCTPNRNGGAAGRYSSSGFTLLGCLLWLLDPNGEKNPSGTSWEALDVHSSYIPNLNLRGKIKFGGTGRAALADTPWRQDEGNPGKRFYSYYESIRCVKGMASGCPLHDTPRGVGGAPGHEMQCSPGSACDPKGDGDWDASSGLFCGNAYGTCLGLAELVYNCISPIAPPDTRIMGNVQSEYYSELLDYAKHPLWNNQLLPPAVYEEQCGDALWWGNGLVYNVGWMGLWTRWWAWKDVGGGSWRNDWFNGHIGATYGYRSVHVYVPMGTHPQLPSLDFVLVAAKNTEWGGNTTILQVVQNALGWIYTGGRPLQPAELEQQLQTALDASVWSWGVDRQAALASGLVVYENADSPDSTPLMPGTRVSLALYSQGTSIQVNAVYAPTPLGTNADGVPSYRSECDGDAIFFFGSGTKPVTASFVASRLYALWSVSYPDRSFEHFLKWYRSVSFAELWTLTSGFSTCSYVEDIDGDQRTMQEWLYGGTADNAAKGARRCGGSAVLSPPPPRLRGIFTDAACALAYGG